jgi:hypothetical protein
MKPHFVADGERRLRECPEFQARLGELRANVEARYASEMAGADFLRRLILRWRIAAECRREQRKLLPSPQTLYSTASHGS